MTKISDLHLFCDGCEIDLGDYSVSFYETHESSLILIQTYSINDQKLVDSLRLNGNHIDVDIILKDVESQQFYRSNGVALCYNVTKSNITKKQIQVNLNKLEKCSASETLLWKI